jgi:DNA-binding LacI/PurR family transcriptional regulator
MERDASAVVELADRMLADIRERRLTAGDAYLSAADAAKKLRTSTTKANRALQLLERRRVLTRSQRKGSYIAPLTNSVEQTGIRRVNLVVAQNYLKMERLLADGVVVGIQTALPEADLQFRFISEAEDPEAVERILAESLRSTEQEGFVLVRAPHPVQKAILDSGLPTVIYGTPYPMLRTAIAIDRDHAEIGQMLTSYLLNEGARRILVLLRPLLLFGDNLLLDGVRRALREQKLDDTELIVRCLPPDREVVAEVIAQLARENDAPLGVLARSEPLADAVGTLFKERSKRRRAGKIAAVCVADVYPRGGEGPRWPCARILLSPEQVGERIGQLLKAQIGGRMPEEPRERLAVSLQEPAE